MSAGAFQELIRNAAPEWCLGPNGARFLEAVGLTIDAAYSGLTEGLDASKPLNCEEDALEEIARDRGIRLYASEPVASKRKRLAQWHKLHRRRGSHLGEMLHLQPYFLATGVPLMRCVFQAGDGGSATWVTLYPDGTHERHVATPSNWNWDGDASQWSRFWLIIYISTTGLQTPPLWDDGVSKWDDGVTYWDGIAKQVRDDIISAIKDWKAAHSKLVNVILTSDGASFDPTSTAVTDPDGWTSLPVGNWWRATEIGTGIRTRPPYTTFLSVG